jgi:hypothetical protein
MDRMRKTALVAGALYLVTFVTSIPALGLYEDVLNNPDYILGAGGEAGVMWGAFLEIILGLACIGTAVALFPVVKKQHEGVALGFVTARLLEAAMIFVGILSLLAVLTLRQDTAGASGAEAASLVNTGRSLVAVHDWTFLLGPTVIAGVNALCLGYLLYRSRLVPRILPVLGLIGAPILFASATATLFGVYDQVSTWALIAALPIAVWEFSLGVWLVVKGFKPSPLIANTTSAVRDADGTLVPAVA